MKCQFARITTVLIALVMVAVLCHTGRAQVQENLSGVAFWGEPLTNPIYGDSAWQKREISLVGLYQRLPDRINTLAPGDTPLGGDVMAGAIQLELPLVNGLSLVANKSGYMDIDPDDTLDHESGLIDLSAGLKWTFHQTDDVAIAARTTVELTTGDEKVLQDNGEGNISPALLMSYAGDNVALNGTLGMVLPIDGDEESEIAYLSLASAMKLGERLSGLLEVNWFRVIDEGDGTADYPNQGGQVVPGVAEFDGSDVINLGAANGKKHRDSVSAAIGLRYAFTDSMNLGIAYEMPLTEDGNGLMYDRVTMNLTIAF